MTPFTRNVFDPMDFTPMALDKINDRITRRTTPAFELALSVLFTSGIQHYGEIPSGMEKMPGYVKKFLKGVPSVWEDVRFVDDYPGKYVVMARQGDGRWYVAGINGEDSVKELELNLSGLGAKTGSLVTGDNEAGFDRRRIKLDATGTLAVTLAPQGGFVIELD